ncbi:single-stranded-DNA-specific exonuclease RecJ [Bacteroidia bacterium]|nr:single-stranded-DNA-specific exonuclease RecJ [Bacteroidia bacterium]
MKKTWIVNEQIEEEKIAQIAPIDKLAEKLDCLPNSSSSTRTRTIVANLLLQRGIKTVEEVKDFFNPSLDMLHDPFLMRDMDKAVERLDKAIAHDEKILIYGDYDVDGTTAVALLYKYLKDEYKPAFLEYYIPDRYTEGYGVSLKGIDYAADNGFALMIVTDCGVKAVEKVKHANERGVDIIICDHHQPGDVLPNAVAVLDPQRKDCPYPYKWLSGCGVSFKLIHAHTKRHNLPMSRLYKLLDLVCVSIASDIVPITGENRILAYFGLQQLNDDPCLGLKTIIKAARVFKALTINDIVFRVGPKINAAGRVESGNSAVSLLTADEDLAPKEVTVGINRLNRLNEKRKNLDHEITDAAIKMIRQSEAEQFQTSGQTPGQTLGETSSPIGKTTTVLYNPAWHKGVVGIVASRLTETFYRPTIVLTQSQLDGFASGSARSVEGFDLYRAISQCADLLENYGGHKYAAGLTLRIENIEPFKARFEKIVAETIEDYMLAPLINVDAKLKLQDITPELYEILKKFAPFGPDNTNPVFMTERVVDCGGSDGSRRVGKDNEHLRLVVIEKDDTRCKEKSGIGFGMGDLYNEISGGAEFDVCYTLQENTFMGKTDVQMMVRDVHIH